MFSYPVERSPLDEYVVLGDSGLKVSRLTLGTMNFGTNWNMFLGECSKDAAREIFRTYVTAGGNLVDTADKYQEGQSEEWIGEFIKELEEEGNGFDREDLVIATKYTINTKSMRQNAGGNNSKNMYASVKSSLKRMQLEYLDILYLHVWDYTTSAREVMRSLNNLVASGLVRYIGISDTPAWKVAQLNEIAEQNGWAKFCIYQGKYNISERTLDYDIRGVCQEYKMGITPWNILGGGKFTGRYQRGEEDNHDGRKGVGEPTEKEYDIIEVLLAITDEQNKALAEREGLSEEQLNEDERKITPSQVTLAWALEQSGITTLLVGGRKVSHITDNIRALSLTLTDDQLARLEEVSSPEGYFPFTLIGKDMFQAGPGRPGGRFTPLDWTRNQSNQKFN